MLVLLNLCSVEENLRLRLVPLQLIKSRAILPTCLCSVEENLRLWNEMFAASEEGERLNACTRHGVHRAKWAGSCACKSCMHIKLNMNAAA